MRASRNESRRLVMFDDDHAVAEARLALVGVLREKRGLFALAEELVDLRPLLGRRVAMLSHAMVADTDCIDDADVLRAASTAEVLGHRVMAPSTLETFLPVFGVGHVRQLDRLSEMLFTRAWAIGAAPSWSR